VWRPEDLVAVNARLAALQGAGGPVPPPAYARAWGTARVPDDLSATTEEQARALARAAAVTPPAPGHDAGPWPAPLDAAALHGLAGEFVRRVGPHSEADPAALLFQLLAAAGNAAGPGPHYRVEGDEHPPRIWVLVVGDTAKARKGTSAGRVRELMASAAPVWAQTRVAQGLSTGEGLISEVRDPVPGRSDKDPGDPGVADKRLLVSEGEFAAVLRQMGRHGNTLSAVLRNAWDRGDLRTMTRSSPLRATGAHVTVVAHITAEELRRQLDRTEVANGLANRFLFCCARRSKALPHGGGAVDWGDLPGRLAAVLEAARAAPGAVAMDAAARAAWEAIYPDLSEGRPGLLGAATARSEAYVLRLAVAYALLDGLDAIGLVHLRAALAVWDYAEASARHVFGDAAGDPLADRILGALRAAGGPLTRTALSAALGRHAPAGAIERALEALRAQGRVRRGSVPTAGRAAETWEVI
jgi:hypothetical protein